MPNWDVEDPGFGVVHPIPHLGVDVDCLYESMELIWLDGEVVVHWFCGLVVHFMPALLAKLKVPSTVGLRWKMTGFGGTAGSSSKMKSSPMSASSILSKSSAAAAVATSSTSFAVLMS